jgi:general secretion pathway protein G
MCYERLESDEATKRRSGEGGRRACFRLMRGFSLIEMMVVLVLIGILASLVTVNVRHYMIKGKQEAARAQISAICTALETFYGVYGRYPTNDEGLEILARKSDRLPEPLMRQIPLDPWNNPYVYNSPGRSEPYEVISFGADGREGGEGADSDIVSWQLQESGDGTADMDTSGL